MASGLSVVSVWQPLATVRTRFVRESPARPATEAKSPIHGQIEREEFDVGEKTAQIALSNAFAIRFSSLLQRIV
jgi:hypothetical protein